MLLKQIERKVNDAILQLAQKAGIAKESVPSVSVTLAEDPSHGELATNAAMVLSKIFHQPPRSLAEQISLQLQKKSNAPMFQKLEIAGPGFLNMTLNPELWIQELAVLIQKGKAYSEPEPDECSKHSGSSETQSQKKEKILVEFISANPTGPMHAGHVRNAVLGDVIVSLLQKMGHTIFKEYYINDAGNQVHHLGRSVYLRYRECLGEVLSEHAFDGDLYPGDYLKPIGQKIADRDGKIWLDQPEDKWLLVFCDFAIDAIMDMIRKDMKDLGVTMDFFTSEKKLTQEGKVDQVLALLKEQGDIYEGVLNPPKGVEVDDWEERPQTLFRATNYGDDIDRALKKSDGSWTYFAGDIAYHYDKVQRGFFKLIDVFGADHCGYIKRITAATKAVSHGQAELSVRVFQLVNFFENGQPVKMSKRAGTFISAQDIIQRVGKDATRFMMISKNSQTIIDFDFQKVLEQSQDNPIFYIQYAHARICSVFSKAKELFPKIDEQDIKRWACCANKAGEQKTDLSFLKNQEEISVIRKLASWPDVVEQAAAALEPHRIASYLYDLAGEFHRLWNLGKTSLYLRFIDKDHIEVTKAKLSLLLGIATVLRDGLEIIGITPVYKM